MINGSEIRDLVAGRELWKCSTEDTLLNAAHKMERAGMPWTDVLGILADIFHAVAEEYGD